MELMSGLIFGGLMLGTLIVFVLILIISKRKSYKDRVICLSFRLF